MRKTVYTLNVNDYEPEICALTYPLIERWADKIGAEFYVISERLYPELDPMMEKLQLYDLTAERGDDWSIFIDSDALIHPDTMDMTEVVPPDTVFYNAVDFAPCRYLYDRFFRRDGRHIASCNWFTAASSLCRELWKPLEDISYAEAVSRIKPTQTETRLGRSAEHFIDDYILSRNIAMYGLKVVTFRDILAKIGQVDSQYLWHEYTLTAPEKLRMIKKVLSIWTGGAYAADGEANQAVASAR